MERSRIDPLTVAAMAVVVWCATNQLHEALGHGGACLVVGGRPRLLDAMFFDCDEDALGDGAIRLVAAAGAIVNLAVACAVAATERWWGRASQEVRYVAWLFAATNVLTAFGYLCFSSLGGIGDWYVVVDGLPGIGGLRVAELVVGSLGYFWLAPLWLVPRLEPWLGSVDRVRRARLLTTLPYVVGGVALVIGGLPNPHGAWLVLISGAAASFGGNSLLAWYFAVRAERPGPGPGPGGEVLGVERRWGWVAAAVVVLAVFTGILGPGIRLGD